MTKVNSQNLARRLLVMLVAFAVVFTYIPQEAFAANGWRPGSKAYFRNGGDVKGSDGKYFYNDSRRYSNRWYGSGGLHRDDNSYALRGPRHSFLIKPTDGGPAVQGYCLEQDVANPSTGNVKYVAEEWENSEWMQKYSGNVQRGMQLTLLYAKQPDSKTSDIEKLFGVKGASLNDWLVASQQIIWEWQQGLRASIDDIPKNPTSKNLGTSTYHNTPKDFFYTTVKGRKAGEVYLGMLKAMAKHRIIPSFTSYYQRNAGTIYMEEASAGVWKAVNSKYAYAMEDADREIARAKSDYYTLTDEDTCGHDLRVLNGTAKDSAYTFTQTSTGKYTLTYKGASLPNTAKHGKKNIKETTKENLLTWQNPGTHYQTIAIGADDPVDFYFKMKPLRTMGENDIEFFPEVRFPVHKNDKNTGWDDSVHTGMGDASLGATFELYRGTELVDTVTLDAYGETDYLTDIPWQDPEDVPKAQSGTKTHMVDSQPHCTVTPTKTTWDDTTTYTIVEIPPAGRHAESPTVSRTFKVTYHAESISTQECMNDDQTWGPINYKVDFKENGSTNTVQGTIASGSVTLDYVHDFAEQVFVNDNYRGLLEIIKTKDDLNPFTDGKSSDNGVKAESTKSKWTIQLKSGGYEENPYVRVVPLTAGGTNYDILANNYKATRDDSGTPADENNPLVVNENGKIRITDLPYGTYIVKEIEADNNGYVLESFEVVVSKDNQTISKKVNNPPKTNKIKVVKTNSETGKTVRWDADRTAFRIRYMGHSEYGDPEDVENYNKLLPNSSAYTNDNGNYVFYANKNGEITLPYEIEYGHYQLEEIVVPNGYYVGAYDNDGNGTIADMGSVKIVDHEGQAVTLPKSFAQTVQVRDADGNKVTEFTGNNMSILDNLRVRW
ncbi:hypothetical protein M2140_001828 [Clostridiales Family XIII bacterium PM5-7]